MHWQHYPEGRDGFVRTHGATGLVLEEQWRESTSEIMVAIMVQQFFPTTLKPTVGAHPRRVLSINYDVIVHCHGRGRD